MNNRGLVALLAGIFIFIILTIGDFVAPNIFFGNNISNYLVLGIVGGISALLADLVVKKFK